jgi:hypothetical protein
MEDEQGADDESAEKREGEGASPRARRSRGGVVHVREVEYLKKAPHGKSNSQWHPDVVRR